MSLASSEIAPRRDRPLTVAVVSTPRNWAALLTLLFVAGVVIALTPFLPGLLGSLALYVIARKPYQWLARRVRPAVSAGIVVVAALLLIIGPLSWVAMVLIDRAPGAVTLALDSPLLTSIGELRVGGVQVAARLPKISETIITSLPSQLVRRMGTATSIVVNLTLALFGLYFLLTGSSGTWDRVRTYVPFSARTADALRDRFIGATQATVLGTGMTSIAQGLLIGFGFAITGLPEPVFWGAVAAITAMIPGIGSTLVWLPGVLLLASEQRYGAAATLVVFGFGLAGNVDQVIRPLVYRRLSEMHPMVTLVGVLAGIRYVGIVGLLLGPLAIVYVFELLRFYREEYLSE